MAYESPEGLPPRKRTRAEGDEGDRESSVLLIIYKLPCINLPQLLSLQSHSHENSDSEVEHVCVTYHSSVFTGGGGAVEGGRMACQLLQSDPFRTSKRTQLASHQRGVNGTLQMQVATLYQICW